MLIQRFQTRLAAILVAMCLATPALAGPMLTPTPVTAGTGTNLSYVQIDFDASTTALFEVSYNGAPSAYDLLVTLDTELGSDFFLHTKDFGGSLGQFVFGLGYLSDVIDDPEEDFSPTTWNYWVRDDLGDAWASSGFGISSVLADDGDWHGFTNGTFGNHPTPNAVPEPASLVMVGMLVCGALSRRRRKAVRA